MRKAPSLFGVLLRLFVVRFRCCFSASFFDRFLEALGGVLGGLWGAKLGPKSVQSRIFLASFLHVVCGIDFLAFFVDFLEARILKNEVFAWEGCHF